jgi:DNA-directed RNA polymerase subunit F
VLEHLAKIAAVDPAAAGRASDEMLGLTNRRLAELLPQISAARKADH